MSIFKGEQVVKQTNTSKVGIKGAERQLSPQELSECKRIFREIFSVCKRNGVQGEDLVKVLKDSIIESVQRDTEIYKWSI